MNRSRTLLCTKKEKNIDSCKDETSVYYYRKEVDAEGRFIYDSNHETFRKRQSYEDSGRKSC